jgi:hypothetical protein
MNSKDEALKMAIEKLELWHGRYISMTCIAAELDFKEIINACKEALEQPAQEPVAYLSTYSKANEIIKTYQAQPLSDDEITNLEADSYFKTSHDTWEFDVYGFARAIEQTHGIGVKE